MSTLRAAAALPLAMMLMCGGPVPQASATPPGFPNLDAFSPASLDAYLDGSGKGLRHAYFSTPYNIQCSFEAGEAVPAWSSQAISCRGDIPGMPVGSCTDGTAQTAGMGPAYAVTPAGGARGGAPFSYGTPLNIGQKLSYRNATCAVGADHVVACLDTTRGEHGFVLKPSGSEAF